MDIGESTTECMLVSVGIHACKICLCPGALVYLPNISRALAPSRKRKACYPVELRVYGGVMKLRGACRICVVLQFRPKFKRDPRSFRIVPTYSWLRNYGCSPDQPVPGESLCKEHPKPQTSLKRSCNRKVLYPLKACTPEIPSLPFLQAEKTVPRHI